MPINVPPTGAAMALIVEDDRDSSDAMSRLLIRSGMAVAQAHTLRQARDLIAVQRPDLVLLDLSLPDGSGMELCEDEELLAHSEIVLITGNASLETSIKALRLGASDYLIKPVASAQLDAILARFRRPAESRDPSALWSQLERSGRFGPLVGNSAAMRAVYERILRVAQTAVTVLIEGQSGTGKALAARMIHTLSRRSDGPFLPVHCGAISSGQMESQLFGHEADGARRTERVSSALFDRARGGTLFLDEITELPIALQAKLLRLLDSGGLRQAGDQTMHQADVRVIAATHHDPVRAVEDGLLREDLYYRLNVFSITMPPLHERLEDLPALARHFADQISRAEGRERSLSPSAIDALMRSDWVGNLRELRNAVFRAYVMAAGSTIEASDLVVRLPQTRLADPQRIAFRIGTKLADVERELILATYARLGQSKERTAATLGISLKTLYNRLRDYRRGDSRHDGRADDSRAAIDKHGSLHDE